MCVDVITEVVAKPTAEEVYAWKFVQYAGEGEGETWVRVYRHPDGTSGNITPLQRDVWYKAREVLLKDSSEDHTYVSGFHAFANEINAHSWVANFKPYIMYKVVKVKLRYITFKGIQSGRPVLVARECMYLSEENQDARS